MLDSLMPFLPYVIGAGVVTVWPTPFMWARGLVVNAMKWTLGMNKSE